MEPAQPIITAAGYQRESVAAPTPSGLPQSVAGTIGAAVNEQEGALVRLVSVNRDGSDGPAFPVTGDPFDIGRRTATLLFEEDGYLDDRHARIEWRQGAYHLMDLDSRNGVYVRIQDREEIKDGHKKSGFKYVPIFVIVSVAVYFIVAAGIRSAFGGIV